MLTARRAAAAVAGTLIALFTAACTSHPAAAPADPGPPAAVTPASPAATGTPAISGVLYYLAPDQPSPLFGSTPTGLTRVLAAAGYEVNVSPDGQQVAFIGDDNELQVTDRDGNHARTVMHGVANEGVEPIWSPDGTRLLVARLIPNGPGGTPGIVEVATGRFTPLPHDPGGIHYLWSADGRHLGYATGVCELGVSDPDGFNARPVPVLGSTDPKVNPDLRRSCDPFSISPDGSRMAVILHTGDMPDGDIGRSFGANAVIDTRTGASVRLPVTGTVTAVLFQRDGSMLVRSSTGLVLLSADGTVLARATESAAAEKLLLLAYVPA